MTDRGPHRLFAAPLALRRGLWLTCALLLLGPTARSAELVQVRVGNHPTFTRVVFEFDAPTGYRLERHSDDEAENTIVVTFDAASPQRTITSRSPGVSSVSVEASQSVALARIVARKSGMAIKEMILADPPRVVLDLMLPVSAVATVAPTVSVPEPEPAEASAPIVLADADASVPGEGEIDLPTATRTPAPVEDVAELDVPTPTPRAVPERVVEEPLTAEAMEDIDLARRMEEIAAAEDAEIEHDAVPPKAVPPTSLNDEVDDEIAALVADDEAAALAAEFLDRESDEPAAEPHGQAKATPPRASSFPAAPAAQEPEPSKFGYLKMGAITAGAISLLLVGFLVVRRRRAIPIDMDVTSLTPEDDAVADDRPLSQAGSALDASSGGTPDTTQAFEFGSSDEPGDESKSIEAVGERSLGSGLFDEARKIDEGSAEGEAKTMDHQELTNMGTDADAATHLAAGAAFAGEGVESDVSRLVKEMEQRISNLETRLDEANDARERVERQVAAQSEELRVQRAAIARTQRALRSLNRSQDDQATEPALREPSKPGGSR